MPPSPTPAPAPCLYAGGDLYRRLVRAGGLLAEGEVARDVVVPLLLTLTFLHASNIVHRRATAGGCTVFAGEGICNPTRAALCMSTPTRPACFCTARCRDIKPENIFFTADGGLRLGDFGLSIDARVERPTSRVGTLDYM